MARMASKDVLFHETVIKWTDQQRPHLRGVHFLDAVIAVLTGNVPANESDVSCPKNSTAHAPAMTTRSINQFTRSVNDILADGMKVFQVYG
jgi:hypothetical protein